MNAEIKLWMAQIETAKMATAAVQVGQLATTKEMKKMIEEMEAAIKKVQNEIAKQQSVIENSK